MQVHNQQQLGQENYGYRESPNKASQDSPSQQDQQVFQEMDLNVYEDDDDETLHRKLVAAKIARKRAEEDKKLLSNRLSLLKQEE
jgi:hypothetical protein